jgi:hypothetical protein
VIGIINAANIDMIAITTNNSISVKANRAPGVERHVSIDD